MSESEHGNILDLVELADSLFDRATELEEKNICKKDKEALKYLEQLKNDSYLHCIKVWKSVLSFLPQSTIEQSQKKELLQDANKIISRCYQKLGEYENAKVHIARAIDNGYIAGFISLGAISIKLNDFDGAQSAFKSAISKKIMESRAHAGLGELYFIMGNAELKKDPDHVKYFKMAEEEFITAGKDRFTDGFERAIELFDKIGLKGRALSVGESAVAFYDDHKGTYGEKLKSLDKRLRKLAGDEKHDKIVNEIGIKIRKIINKK
ncbi:MAG: hypothetical protein JXR91_08740 [Deltaproteobacteria bacterium]|nr:hypothetical protein [Deltaproteobacteria bacterium]